MNGPHVPRNSRDWDSIDIFVFSNGQQYSPPRKYHLEADDLKWWDATKSYLAKSQYGSMHSTIDLYLLDGQKIEGPLELKNSAAYVAVEPPDTFISAGYEKYLFKASRSWEKRQGKLSNGYVVGRTDKTGTFLDITTIEQIVRIVSLKSDSSPPEPTKTINQAQKTVEKPTFSKLNSAKIDKLFQKKKSSDNERSASLNKKPPSKLHKNDLVKTKNILKPQKCSNKPISPKYSRIQRKPFIGNRVECKANPKRNNLQDIEIVNNSKFEPSVFNNTNIIKTNIENDPDKNLLDESQVYKNNESDEKSVLLETNPNTIDGNSTKKIFEACKDNEFNNILTPHILKMDTASSIHFTDETTVNLPPDNNKQKLNIKLRIKLEDLKSSKSEGGNNLEKDKSFVTLIKKEMASQVNIDVILGKDILTLNNYLFLNEKSKNSNITKYEEYIPSNDEVKEIFVHCTYDNFYPKLSPLNDSCRQNMLILPTEMNEYLLKSCCKCNQEKIEMVNKGIQKSLSSSSSSLNLANTNNDKTENITKDKVAILREVSIENKSYLQTELQHDMITVEKNVPSLLFKIFDDKSTQTGWCNIVLQAKIHEEGRYSFHLPALSLFKQYNIDQM